LIASGMQVMAVTFGAMIEAGFLRGGGMGSPGLDEVRWHKPVYADDEIRMQATVLESRASGTRPAATSRWASKCSISARNA
jgi:acyl dehydratase